MINQKLEKIYVVFKTHFDIGFTGLVADVVHRYRHDMLKDVIDICESTRNHEEHERYVWTMSAWPLKQSLEGSDEDSYNKALQILDRKQLAWHVLPYTTHTEFCGLEEWIRGMYFSRELSEKYGYYPKDAKMTDVPGHTWIVPSLLKQAGVQFLHLGCNPASTPPQVPDIFWWEGPDGERLLTYYSKGQYGTGILPPEEWEHPVWLAMIQTGDNQGVHHPSIIEEMKTQIHASGCNAELHIGTLQDFAEDFLSRNPQLPVVRGDLADAWIHGVGTAPKETSHVRKLRGLIASTESAVTLLATRNMLSQAKLKELKQSIATSYEQSLHFGEHTWGLDCKTFLFPRRYNKSEFLEDKQSERYQLMEHSWQEQRDYLNKAEDSILLVKERLYESAGRSRKHDSSRELNHNQWMVFNHLGWKRDVMIELGNDADLAFVGDGFEDISTGDRLKITQIQNKKYAIVKDVPALGYRLIASHDPTNNSSKISSKHNSDSKQQQAAASDDIKLTDHGDVLTVENRYFSIRITKQDGTIISFWDKEMQHEFVDTSSDYRFGQYEYNIYSNREITRYLKKYGYRYYDWGIYDFGKIDYPEEQKRLRYMPQSATLQIDRSDEAVSITVQSQADSESIQKYGNARRLIWTLTLYRDKREVDFSFHMKDKQETPLAESGSIIFPLNIKSPVYRMNKLGSVLDPLTEVVKGASTLLNCCESFIDITNPEQSIGMAILPMDSPLFFIGKNGMWDYEPDYKPEKPEIHFNLFNNWWGTNFPQWIGGELSYTYKLIPHNGSWSDANIWKRAEEARAVAYCLPLIEQKQDLQSSEQLKQLNSFSILAEDLDAAAITSFKLAEDGNGYILRLRDWSGQRRKLVIKLSHYVRQVVATDLLEYDRGELQLKQEQDYSVVELDSGPFAVHTLRMKL